MTESLDFFENQMFFLVFLQRKRKRKYLQKEGGAQ
jgi:hypothetical protein